MDNSSDGLTARALGGLFTNVSFNNSPVNISINLQSNVHSGDSVKGSGPQRSSTNESNRVFGILMRHFLLSKE